MSASSAIALDPSTPDNRGGAASRFMTGAGLPVFLCTALLGYEAFLLLTIFGPTEGGWLGDFVKDFRLWCFPGDPRSGGVSWLAVSVMLFEPVFIVGVAAILARRSFGQIRGLSVWRQHWRAAFTAWVLICIVVSGLVYYARVDAARGLILPPFPGESIRVRLALPTTPLIDQKGEPFHLQDLRGRVVLLTGVYAACTTACPEIFEEIKVLMDELPAVERRDLSVVALSLNPEYETTELMDAMTQARGFTHPEFRYVNGQDPKVMREILTQLQFSAYTDPETGIINHANLIMLVDRENHIAYRFTLDPRHRAWLREGLRSLLREN